MPEGLRTFQPTQEMTPSVPEQKRVEYEPVNDGEPPISARLERGSQERYAVCDDAKLHDRRHKLFCVGDGVSGRPDARGRKVGSGAIASEILMRSVASHVGDALDQRVSQLLLHTSASKAQVERLIHTEVESSMRTALNEADQQIRTAQSLDEKYKQAGTTATLSKIVEMNGKKTLYLANIGDSRAYLLRQGRFERLTVDDSLAADAISEKIGLNDQANTPDQYRETRQVLFDKLDQLAHAEDIDDLPDDINGLYQWRNVLHGFVGNGSSASKIKITRIELQDGDRILLATDGLTNTVNEDTITQLLKKESNDKNAEAVLQRAADEKGADRNAPRSPDDISAIVVSVSTLDSAQEYPPTISHRFEITTRLRTGELQAPSKPQGTEGEWTKRLKEIHKAILGKDPKNLAVLEGQEAQYMYWLDRTHYDQIAVELPHRFEHGSSVHLSPHLRSDASEPLTGWVVDSFDKTKDAYRIRHGMNQRWVNRFLLEVAQEHVPFKPGDQFTVDRASGAKESGWKFDHVQKGTAILTHAAQQPIGVPAEVLSRIVKDRLVEAVRLFDSMDATKKRFLLLDQQVHASS